MLLSHLQEAAEAEQGDSGAAAGRALNESTQAPLQGHEWPNKRQKVTSTPVLRDGEVRHPPHRLSRRRPKAHKVQDKVLASYQMLGIL